MTHHRRYTLLLLVVAGAPFLGGTSCEEPEPPPPPPCLCTREYAPVCGADGMTYSNACQAGCAGVDILHEGPCECPPVACPADREDCAWGTDERGCPSCECGPTECYDDSTCAPGERCNLDHCYGTRCGDEPGARCGEGEPAEDPAGIIACSGYCEPDPEPTYCYSDVDCGMGEHCNLDVCYGGGDCGGGEGGVPADCLAACYGICEPDIVDPRCISDEECAPEEYCQIDMCWAPAQEPSDPDDGDARPAPPPDFCTGSCVPRPTTCYYDVDCGEGSFCEHSEVCTAECRMAYPGEGDCLPCPGTCKPIPPPPVCFGDEECAEGEYCDFSERCGAMPYGEPDDGSGDAAIACYGTCRPAAVPLE